MRRLDIATAFNKIFAASKESQLSVLLNSVLNKTDSKIPPNFDFIKMYEIFKHQSENFSQNEFEIIKRFEFLEITELTYWHDISTSRTRDKLSKLVTLAQKWNRFASSAPILMPLLTPDADVLSLEKDEQNLPTSPYVRLIIETVCAFRGIRPPIPTTSGHLNRGIRPPVMYCFEALGFCVS